MEDPLPPEDSAGWRELRDVHLPLSGGEALYTRYGFRDLIAEHRFDIPSAAARFCVEQVRATAR
ncbi:enolase C-terminal domain-like protein [Streptomyces sp. NPDC097640]|uniref:enolase C-terminal domain-like protein n=1 Tax=Streptomyces sp. NPDC097640 TaxID=3157229 RepID=UPI003321F4FA